MYVSAWPEQPSDLFPSALSGNMRVSCLVPHAANHIVVFLGPGNYIMEQCQVAEWTAKRVHSNGQQSKSGLPAAPSEAAQYPYTRCENASDLYLHMQVQPMQEQKRCTNTLAEPTLAVPSGSYGHRLLTPRPWQPW